MLISWSNLPALRRATSSESGLLVAPITMTGLLSFFSQDMSILHINDNFQGWFVTALAVHAGQKLSYNSSLHLPLSTFSFWSNSVYFIYE